MDDTLDRCGVGIRGVAMALDTIVWFALLFAAVFPIAAATGQLEQTADGIEANLEGTLGMLGFATWLALAIGYHTILEARYGKTAGKYLVSITVVGSDGELPSLRAAFLRNVARLVDWLPMFYGVGILAIVLSDDDERLGDRLANTAVVRR